MLLATACAGSAPGPGPTVLTPPPAFYPVVAATVAAVAPTPASRSTPPSPTITPYQVQTTPPAAAIADREESFRIFAVHPPHPFVQLAAGDATFCGLQQDGRALCWGQDLAVLDIIGRAAAGETFRHITVGAGFFCGLRRDDTLKCAGNAHFTSKWLAPAGEFRTADAGKFHACALDYQGQAVCWGWDKEGRATAPAGPIFTEIAAGGAQSCGLDQQGNLHCWGRTDAEPAGPFQSLTLSLFSGCGLRKDGRAQCWNGAHGELRPPPATVFAQISIGHRHGCGIDPAGAAQCWGAGAAATEAPGGRFTAVSSGWNDTCGLRPEGYAECWGSSDLTLPEAPPPADPLPASVAVAFAGRRFAEPVDLFSWPDGATAVVERKGVISSYDAAGAEKLVLDLSAQTMAGFEQGMLSAALDPEFDRFPFIYVYYHRRPDADAGRADGGNDGGNGSGSNGGDGGEVVARLARFPVADGVALGQQELTILELGKRSNVHQGGAIRFGPDGMLYLGLGDNMRDENAASLDTLNGKIIRIDVRNATAEQPYRIPADNPFAAGAGAAPGVRPEIWAYGLRNPWRMSFDRQGRLWVGDVGSVSREELSVATAGANLGWPIFEGKLCVAAGPACAAAASAVAAPIIDYDRNLGCALTGVVAHPRYADMVIFGDLCSYSVWVLAGNGDAGSADAGSTDAGSGGAGWQMRQILRSEYPILSIAAGADGAVYLLTAGSPIHRLEWEP